MEFERLEQAWRSEANRPTPEQQAQLMEELMTTLKTRRATEFLLAGIPFATMTAFTVVAGGAALRGGEAFRGWPGLAMLGVCWVVMIAVFWNGFRARTRDTGAPMRDTLVALLARNRAARRNYQVFWIMAPVFLAPLWFAVERLQSEGRMDSAQGVQALILCGVALLASFGWNTLRFHLALKPEQRRLEALLAAYE